jgi:ABC-type antimicrobial peptide transport system permease subunit
MATGYKISSIRWLVIREQVLILSAGILIGVISAIIATLPSLTSGSEIPWQLLTIMIISVFISGLIALLISVKAIKNELLTENLRKD